MDKAISFANGVRIGEAWLRDSAKGSRKAKAADVSRTTQESPAPVAAEEHATSYTAAVESAPPADLPLQSGMADAVVAASAEAQVPPVAAGNWEARATQSVADGYGTRDGVVASSQAGANASVASATNQPGRMMTATEAATPEIRPASLEPVRGITVGTLNAGPTGPLFAAHTDGEPHRSVTNQTWAAAVFLLALVPPMVASLLLGLSHRAHLIPFAPVWAWMALLIALAATVRSALHATRGSTARRTGSGWIAPVLLGVLLLVPSVVILYLRLTLSPVPLRLAVMQILLYVIAAAALLFTSHAPERV